MFKACSTAFRQPAAPKSMKWAKAPAFSTRNIHAYSCPMPRDHLSVRLLFCSRMTFRTMCRPAATRDMHLSWILYNTRYIWKHQNPRSLGCDRIKAIEWPTLHRPPQLGQQAQITSTKASTNLADSNRPHIAKRNQKNVFHHVAPTSTSGSPEKDPLTSKNV